MTRKLIAVLEEDSQVGGYTATIPELPGCISEGDTVEKALANVREAAALYLDDGETEPATHILVREVEVIA